MLPGAGHHLAVISAWIVDGFPYGFDPKLAPWFATCKDAIRDVRGRLEEERREKDAVMGWALANLSREYQLCADLYSTPRRTPRGASRVYEMSIYSEDLDVYVSRINGMLDMIDYYQKGDLRRKQALANDLRRVITATAREVATEGPPLATPTIETHAAVMDAWEMFQCQRMLPQIPDGL